MSENISRILESNSDISNDDLVLRKTVQMSFIFHYFLMVLVIIKMPMKKRKNGRIQHDYGGILVHSTLL